MSDPRIREERPEDLGEIHRVEAAAFAREAEADLVDDLRQTAHPHLSLVAEREARLIGHVFFSPVTFDPAAPQVAAGALGPLAVDPAEQGSGVGRALVEAGLARCPTLGWQAVFLLGDPRYYARFGFTRAAERDIHYQGLAFDAHFQVIELVPGALEGVRGLLLYPDAFERTGSA